MVGRSLSQEEVRLARQWYLVDNLSPKDNATRLGRDKSTLTRFLVKRAPRKPRGRKQLLSEATRSRIETKLKELVQAADGKHEITVDIPMSLSF